jgi:hypothetical protein
VSVGLPPEAPPPQLKGVTGGPPPAAPPPQALGYGGLGVLPDPPMRGSGMPGVPPNVPMPPLSRTTSHSKKSSVASKRMSMSRAEKEHDREMERELFKDLYPKGAKKTTPVPEQMQRQPTWGGRPGGKRRDSGQYAMLSGGNPMPGVQRPPPGAPMPPDYRGAYAGW